MKLVGISGMRGVADAVLERYGEIVAKACPDARVDIFSKEILPEDEIIERLQGYDILMSGFQPMTEKAYADTNLKAYIACSIGFDFTNPEAATKHGVVVTNNPLYCLDEVAEHAAALILSCARGINTMTSYVKNGNWGFGVLRPMNRFKGSTVGLYGFGRIPRMVAKRLSGFDLKIITADPFITAGQAKEGGAELVDFNTLIERSDYISIHAPLNKSTQGVFNKDVFKKMKNTAYLINTARGPIVDQEALYRALVDGDIRGAALDVLEHEPPQESDRKIIELPNVVCTGHCAFYSDDALDRQTELTAENIIHVLKGELPENIVNREVLETINWNKTR